MEGTFESEKAVFILDATALRWRKTNDTAAGWSSIPIENIICFSLNMSTLIYTVMNDVSSDTLTTLPYVFGIPLRMQLPQEIALQLSGDKHSSWLIQYPKTHQPYLRVLISEHSNNGLALTAWQNLVKPLLQYHGLVEDWCYSVHNIADQSRIDSVTCHVILPEANDGHPQYLLLLDENDGLIELINALLSAPRTNLYCKPTLMILTIGTNNEVAHIAGITDDNTMGLRTAVRGKPQPLPIFEATLSPGAKHLVRGSWEILNTNANSSPNFTVRGATKCCWSHEHALAPTSGIRISIQRPRQIDWEDVTSVESKLILTSPGDKPTCGLLMAAVAFLSHGVVQLTHTRRLDEQKTKSAMSGTLDGKDHVETWAGEYEEIRKLKVWAGDNGGCTSIIIGGRAIVLEIGGWMEVELCSTMVLDLYVQA